MDSNAPPNGPPTVVFNPQELLARLRGQAPGPASPSSQGLYPGASQPVPPMGSSNQSIQSSQKSVYSENIHAPFRMIMETAQQVSW